MFKKSILLSTILFMCLLINPTFSLANQEIGTTPTTDSVQPRWTYIASYQNTFEVSTKGKVEIMVILYSLNVDSIKIQADLQQYKNGTWTTIKTWIKTSENINCNIQESWYVVSGNSYRLVSTGTVYKNGKKVEQTTYTSPVRNY